jgi:hypothetical protein
MEDYKETEKCKTCFFHKFCQNVNLPHCNEEDYVPKNKELRK